MIWQLFRWSWKLQSPLFVGATPAGALNRCRLYVPARAVWGAVTAELARLEGTDDQKYCTVREELRENARFSYLYPAGSRGERWLAWLPEYHECDGLVWVCEDTNTFVPDRRFRRRLLWTRPAAAIDPGTDSALDGSFRETECVQPLWSRDDGSLGNPVGMVGYVFLRNGEDLANRLFSLSTLFVGGDTRYGLGRLERVAVKSAKEFFCAPVTLDHAEPHVSTKCVLAHAPVVNGASMCGELEAMGGWDMTDQEQGRWIRGPAWTPGSQIVGEGGIPQFTIDKHGLWRIEE